MTRNAFLNAGAAFAYIALVASFMFYASDFLGEKDTVLAPIIFLSLFVLSALVMGYTLLYQPIRLYLDGEKTGAVTLLLKTMGAFALCTVGVLVASVVITAL